MRGDAPAIVLILLCIFLPPVAVGIVNDWGSKFWFDILLTLLFYFPGMIYAFFVCFG
ncbi:MAG: YqaE/Pmp3 family membrane protein [Bacteroidetes bacterium]|nr:MAG: YqaE/Pmp3 family membrane protein [Bacteroidota bacterium]